MSGVIDRLFPDDWNFGGPERDAASKKTAQIREKLTGLLDQSEKGLIEAFCAAYNRETDLEIKDAYTQGVFDGMELMTECFRRRRGRDSSV